MESFFFNITDTRYKIQKLYEDKNSYIKKTDISNGIIYLDINLKDHDTINYDIKNLDHMIVISVIKKGSITLKDNLNDKTYHQNTDEIVIYASNTQDIRLTLRENNKSEIFVLFIADFFLRRYLSLKKYEPVDFLYEKLQNRVPVEVIQKQSTDAKSLYLIEKIISIEKEENIKSLRGIYHIIEFIIDRISLLDLSKSKINKDEYKLAQKAKNYLLKNYINPPTIKELAHICATNESKIKTVFKKAYSMTINNYIQQQKLQLANKLLKNGELSIGEISKKVGYKHQGYFSNLFFQKYSIYPKDLKKSQY